jgi:acyl-CoA thioester hydrolase
MGTFYNSRALEWFECARSELMRRQMGMSYAEMEAQGYFLPLVEAHLEFLGGARYDDLLRIVTEVEVRGRARLHFEVVIHHVSGSKPVVRGYTTHAFVGSSGRPVRPPEWFLQKLESAAAAQSGGASLV